jgi:hypothetical protein
MAIRRYKVQGAWVDEPFVTFQHAEMVMYADHAAEVERLRAVIKQLLDSACPHPVEHPTMTTAWAVARAALEQK